MATKKELLKLIVPATVKKWNIERKKAGRVGIITNKEVFNAFKGNKKSTLESRFRTLKSQKFIK